MRETRPSGSEGGAAQLNAPFLPLSSEPARDYFARGSVNENVAPLPGVLSTQMRPP